MTRGSDELSYRLILDSVPAMLLTTTPQGEVEYVNRAMLEYFGTTLERLQAWQTGFDAVHPDDFERIASGWADAIRTGATWIAEQRLRRFDGVYRWFHAVTVPHRDEQGRITRYYGVMTDIEDLRRSASEMRDMQSRLARASHLAEVSELSAALAHEVNQPLAAVLSNAEACRRWLGGAPPNLERALRSLDRIVRDAQAGGEIIQRMRGLFRRAPPVKERLDLNDVIHEVLRMLHDDLRRNGIRLSTSLSALPAVAADRVQIQQVLVNLVRNGIEAMEGLGALQKQLSVSSRVVEAEVVIEVCDEGPGVQDAVAVFETFYTTKPGGMGMGLAVSRSVIEAHGGRLWAEAKLPRGMTFSIALCIG